MKISILIQTVGLLLCSLFLSGQETTPTEDSKTVIVTLKTGSTIKGDIVEWKIGEYIILDTPWNDTFKISALDIDQINSLDAKQPSSQYNFIEKGLYYTAKLNYIFGNEGTRANSANGLGGSVSAGWKFHRLLTAGVGVGYDRYIWKSGENLLPIFAEVSSFFFPKNNTLFANVQAGYSFAFEDDQYLITESKGGLFFYPSVGLRLGKSDARCTVDLGYKIQRAEFTYRDNWSSTTAEQRLTYRRLSLRLGILL